MSLQSLRKAWPWPATRPELPENWQGWLRGGTSRLLDSIARDATVIVELGTWYGLSARHWLEVSQATLICIDHWQGCPHMRTSPDTRDGVGTSQDQCVANLWPWRDRTILVPLATRPGLSEVWAHSIVPSLIYIDADHSPHQVRADVQKAHELFPDAVIAGDDYDWPGVADALHGWAAQYRKRIEVDANAWRVA